MCESVGAISDSTRDGSTTNQKRHIVSNKYSAWCGGECISIPGNQCCNGTDPAPNTSGVRCCPNDVLGYATNDRPCWSERPVVYYTCPNGESGYKAVGESRPGGIYAGYKCMNEEGGVIPPQHDCRCQAGGSSKIVGTCHNFPDVDGCKGYVR